MSTDHALIAMLGMLRSWQAQLPTLVHIRVDPVRRILDLRPESYLDARLWLASLTDPRTEPDRIVEAASGAVWWHADIPVNDWTITVHAREVLPVSVPLGDRARRDIPELDDPTEAMLDGLEMLAWQTWFEHARMVRESALRLAGPLSGPELILDRALPGRGSS